MSFVGQVESDGKTIVNNMIVNTAGILLYNKVIAGLLPKSQSEIVNTLYAAGIVTTIEEFKMIMARAGYSLNLKKMPSALGIEFLNHNAKQEEATHHSIKFSGLYCLASPEGFWHVGAGGAQKKYPRHCGSKTRYPMRRAFFKIRAGLNCTLPPP